VPEIQGANELNRRRQELIETAKNKAQMTRWGFRTNSTADVLEKLIKEVELLEEGLSTTVGMLQNKGKKFCKTSTAEHAMRVLEE